MYHQSYYFFYQKVISLYTLLILVLVFIFFYIAFLPPFLSPSIYTPTTTKQESQRRSCETHHIRNSFTHKSNKDILQYLKTQHESVHEIVGEQSAHDKMCDEFCSSRIRKFSISKDSKVSKINWEDENVRRESRSQSRSQHTKTTTFTIHTHKNSNLGTHCRH